MDFVEQNLFQAAYETDPNNGPPRMLLICRPDDHAARLEGLLTTDGATVNCATSLAAAIDRVGRQDFDVCIVAGDQVDASIADAVKSLRTHSLNNGFRIVALCSDLTFAHAAAVVHSGAHDLLDISSPAEDIADRLAHALRHARAEKLRINRLVRLKRICRKLNRARHDVSDQLDLVCRDLVTAYQEMADQAEEVAMETEFRTLLRQELDIEDLLRTALEFMLGRIGPTNAAVFLPDGFGQFALGAYVNYDCPRQSIPTLLDHLASDVCPDLAEECDPMSFDDASEFAEWLGPECDSGFADSRLIAFSCRYEGECMAVILMFRNRTEPYEDHLAVTIDRLRPILAAEIAKAVRIHNRGQSQWPQDVHDDSSDWMDDFDSGFGGGLAA